MPPISSTKRPSGRSLYPLLSSFFLTTQPSANHQQPLLLYHLSDKVNSNDDKPSNQRLQTVKPAETDAKKKARAKELNKLRKARQKKAQS